VKTIYAEDVAYWKTSSSSPDTWIEKTKRQVEAIGGTIIAEAFGAAPTTGQASFVLAFTIGQDRFKIAWPVMRSKTNNERAARIQAATMLYHDVKAKCISAQVLGGRAAFFSFLLLPDGRAAVDIAAPELAGLSPGFFNHGLLGMGER